MRQKAEILKDIEILRQEIKYAVAEGNENEVELLYADMDELQIELYKAGYLWN